MAFGRINDSVGKNKVLLRQIQLLLLRCRRLPRDLGPDKTRELLTLRHLRLHLGRPVERRDLSCELIVPLLLPIGRPGLVRVSVRVRVGVRVRG